MTNLLTLFVFRNIIKQERGIIMDFYKNFEKVQKAFLKVNKETLTEDFAIQINLIDEEGNGAFYIARQGGVCAIEPYDYKDHTAMIDIKTADIFV